MFKLSDEERIEIKMEGIKEGQREMAITIAKNLIESGIRDLQQIMKITNLPEDVIKSLM